MLNPDDGHIEAITTRSNGFLLTSVLHRIAEHSIHRIGELLPWSVFPTVPAVVASSTWLPLESKMLFSVAYDAIQCILYLRFRSGDVYRYFQFRNDDYQHFLSAESKGRHFLSHIRDCFPYERMAKLQVA